MSVIEQASQPAHAGPSIPDGPTRHFAILRRATRHMAATRDLHGTLDATLRGLTEGPNAVIQAGCYFHTTARECLICKERGPTGVFFSPDDAPALHLVATAGLIGEDVERAYHVLSMESPLFGEVATSRDPLLLNGLRDNPRITVPEWREIVRRLSLEGLAIYPMVCREELLGVFYTISGQPIDTDEFEAMQLFADQAAIAIKGSRLYEELQHHRDLLVVENAYLQEEIIADRGFEAIIGESPALRAVLRQVKQVAEAQSTVLLTGETGTGKELIARAIHDISPRKGRAMIKVNCGAISPGLVESELFGHEKGAFTGALQRRIGRFELADKGTLFMDEVGELSPETQVKLLRALQEQEFERVGGSRPITVDVRLVAATNRNLDEEVAAGRFRSDLYYRLNVFPIRIPPLRERRGDIPLLVRHFLAHFQRRLAKRLTGVTAESMIELQRYSWPGNIRELQNVIERACVLARGPVVELREALNPIPGHASAVSTSEQQLGTLDDVERVHIRRVLEATDGVISGPKGAAKILGLHPNTLRSRMERLGMAD
jgi:formate hydrogenlyase transcriptional activator